MMTPSMERVTELDHADIGPPIWQAVLRSRDALAHRRFLPGVVRRWSGLSDKEAATAQMRNLQGRVATPGSRLTAHVILRNGEPVGMGTAQVYPEVRLNKVVAAAVPPGIARRLPDMLAGLALHPQGEDFAVNTSAWVDDRLGLHDKEELMRFAYAGLASAGRRLAQKHGQAPNVWTIEPLTGPFSVHEGIRAAGYNEVKGFEPARYDDKEARGLQLPPVSRLYVSHG